MSFFNFSSFINNNYNGFLPVLDGSIPSYKYVPLDLSIHNNELHKIDVTSVRELGNYINNHIKKQNGLIAYGGYREERILYKRSSHFGNAKDERNIHLGIDLWSAFETPVYAPTTGHIHSFKNNTNFGDYGPTIILEHNIEGVVFYTLYGHLSLESIQGLKVGQICNQGAQIATLGDDTVNGNYPPHLHFQIIKDLQGNIGDYPGVSSKNDLEFYTNNCPNPNLLLKI